MIRSGSTLQYNIVRLLIEKMGLGKGEGYFLPTQIKDTEKNKLFIEWCTSLELHVVKTHNGGLLSAELDKFAKPGTIKILYIYRDVRDVAVSLMRKENCGLEKVIDNLDNAINVYNDVVTRPNVFVQKYEEIMHDLISCVQEVGGFLEIYPSKEILNEVVQECSMSAVEEIVKTPQKRVKFKLRNFVKRLGLPVYYLLRIKEGDYDESSLFHPDHISKDKGAIGVWKNVLNEKEKKKINTRYETWLSNNGYLTNEDL